VGDKGVEEVEEQKERNFTSSSPFDINMTKGHGE